MSEEKKPEVQENKEKKEFAERYRQATQLSPEARTNPEILNEYLVRHSAYLAYWGDKYAKAIYEAAAARRRRKVIEAEAYVRLRDGWASGKTDAGVSVTEAYLIAKVQTQPEVIASQEAEDKAEFQAQSMRYVVESVKEGGENARDLAASLRKDKIQEPRINKDPAELDPSGKPTRTPRF